MSKFNLTEAAKDILHGNVASKKSGQDKPAKLSGDVDRKSTRLNSSHVKRSRMPSSA